MVPDGVPHPKSWAAGPPRSDDEGWAYARRSEVLDTARMFMLHYLKRCEGTEFSEASDDDRRKVAEECVKLAETVIDVVDSRHLRS